MGRKTQVIHRYMRKERKNGGNTDGDSMGRKRGERLRGTGDEQERERSRGKKENTFTVVIVLSSVQFSGSILLGWCTRS